MFFVEGVYWDSESNSCFTDEDVCNAAAMAQAGSRKRSYRSLVISGSWPEEREWLEQLLDSLHL